MHAGRLALALLAATAAAGCLGVDNMREFKTQLGAREVPDPPTAAIDVSASDPVPGDAVTFSAAPSEDPAGEGLDHVWRFGDGERARGQRVQHAYGSPGTYEVTLTVTDARGRTDQASASVVVAQPNRPPDPSVALTSPDGEAIEEAQVGTTVRFSADGSTDPDGDPLTYRWRLGDGTRAQGADVAHTYQAPGVYQVTVTVRDGRGHASEASVSLPVGLERSWSDKVAAPNTTESHAFPVAGGARLVANLSFPAGQLGSNDLDLAVYDASGRLVAASNGSTPLGASGTQYEEVVVPPQVVSAHDPGAWTGEVRRRSGADVSYDLQVVETFPAGG